ncbi:MAG: hypothetical protein IKP95_12430, partial [Ruminococcus sp.]|nr:hypothetical protein [Ruminococcus sp.]
LLDDRLIRHITQILLAGRQPACVEFRQSDENLDFASDAQGSCGVALKETASSGHTDRGWSCFCCPLFLRRRKIFSDFFENPCFL